MARELPADTPGFSLEERLEFLNEILQAAGRAALVLSGGGMLGTFHVGVAKELFDHGLLPQVIAGSSAGAIVSAVLCTRTDGELQEFFRHWPRADEPATRLFLNFFGETAGPQQVLRRLLRTGAMYEYKGLRANLRRLIGDFTFLESFERTGRILNVSVSSTRWSERPRLLNYLTAPHCVVWSAVGASAAFPGLYEPQILLSRDTRGRFVHFSMPSSVVGGANAPWEAVWRSMSRSNLLMHRPFRDGSVEADLPFQCAYPPPFRLLGIAKESGVLCSENPESHRRGPKPGSARRDIV